VNRHAFGLLEGRGCADVPFISKPVARLSERRTPDSPRQ
jgi:hypothetical protein